VLSTLFQKFSKGGELSNPDPNEPLFVIGDVHGCLPLMERMLRQAPEDHRIILVGDYVDRGENSAEVLRELSTRPDIVCLKGNHEDMLLRFLQDPVREGGRWIRYGGLQTLASFGIGGVRLQMTEDELKDCQNRLTAAMGVEMIGWLAGLKSSVLSGNVLVVHAAADPRVPPDLQKEDTLMWGHPEFARTPRRDGVWVVHGHTIVPKATASLGRIAIDTGAFATGTLSAVCLDGSTPQFQTAQLT
jgi:serine/threonine protein phosphatase 1